ncbi:hypothetical protein LTR86_008421 [Recurvomyces mirabilis]|nr:hypothetical protein LTR86_008421 [Recurvomyces mirabilis]
MASNSGYGTTQAESLNFPWPNLEVIMEMTCEGQQVTPEVHAKVEKGFFPAPNDHKWTCYRRNYFSVTCNFELHPNIINGRLFLKRNGTNEQVQAMGMRLSAAVDGPNGKSIELIAHTPKRDNGPKNPITVIKVAPTPTSGRAEHSLSPNAVYQLPMSTFHATGAVPGVFLPLQHTSDPENCPATVGTPQLSSPSYGGYPAPASSHIQNPAQHISHTFERVQFKSATANNGKRRASQQYFHLIVELFADVRKPESDTATWVKVAQRVSDKIVVRGRSPSHYQNEGQHAHIGRGGNASGGGYNGSGGGYSVNSVGFRGVNGGSYDAGMGHGTGGYRGKQYGMHPGSDGSDSSPDSMEDGAVLNDPHADAIMSDAEHADIHGSNSYLYYPGTIYEGITPQILPPLAKVDSMARYTTDPRQYAVKTEYADAVPGAQWSVRGCRPFQGVESSRGYYPDLSGASAGYT